tara:strand:+ start:122 stop:502 length:381 start_codon:yes stop_codon:yes gene_type:complete
MTGKITVGTIQDTAGTALASTFVTNGVAKSWTRFNTTTSTTLNDSFNVSTLTDLGTGNTQINLTNSMGNTTYAVLGLCQYQSNLGQTIMEGPSDIATGSYEVYVKTNNNVVYDADFNSTAIFGDLA